MNVSVSHLLSREDTDTTTIIRIEIEKRDMNTKYRKTNRKNNTKKICLSSIYHHHDHHYLLSRSASTVH